MTWFEALTGFREAAPEQVRENLSVDGEMMTSHVNGRRMACGRLETPSLGELRDRAGRMESGRGRISVREVVGNVQSLHEDESNAGALFQVASQFNLLEMMSPNVTPEAGVGIYENDRTQGPACAIATGAGTIFRNYFAMVNGQTGQTERNQIDCLMDMGQELGNTGNRLWEMRNGYALASGDGLVDITKRLSASSEKELDALRRLLRVGIQWNPQVTLKDCKHTVSQVYGSALPVAYCGHSQGLWEKFAVLVLEASYEATICAGILNWVGGGNRTVFLTQLGGGAFGNATNWIRGAIERALDLYKHAALDVAMVSYGSPKAWIQQLAARY